MGYTWGDKKKDEQEEKPAAVDLFAQDDQATMYRLALEQGEKRFGSACRHEQVRNGHCLFCLRRVWVAR